MANPPAYDVAKDQYNVVKSDPVEAKSLRIEVRLQPDFSGGIIEVKVE